MPLSAHSVRARATSRATSLPAAAREAAFQVSSRIACSSMAMSATMNATDWRWAIGSPNACALLDVRRDVVEHGLPDPDRERAPGEPREPHALGVRRAVGRAEDGARRGPGRRRASASSGTRPARPSPGRPRRDSPAAPDSTRTSTLASSRRAPTTNSSASAPRGTIDFTPSRTQAVAVARGGGAAGSRASNRGRGSVRASAAAGTSSAGEGREVGLLLLVGAPGGERRRDGAGSQRGDGEAEVALRQRLGHQGAGHHGALLRDAAERLGHAEQRAARSRWRPSSTSAGAAQATSASAAAGRSTSAASSVTTSTSICSSSVGVRSKTPRGGARSRPACRPGRASRRGRRRGPPSSRSGSRPG